MKIEEIQSEWSKDSTIDKFRLTEESLNIPKLHEKYYRFYFEERMRLHTLKMQHDDLEHVLTDFYKKNLTTEELEEYGLEYPDKKIMNADVPRYVLNHKDMVELNMKIAVCQEKIELLKSILKQVDQRSFQINSAIKNRVFEAGG